MTTVQPDTRPLIFISHVSADGQAASRLQEYIDETFLGAVALFNTSSRSTLAPGDSWLARIFSALERTSLLLPILTQRSIKSPWVNFESGAAWLHGAKVVPCCGGGMSKGGLPQPYSTLQAIDLTDSDDLEQLMVIIGQELSFRVPEHSTATLAANLAIDLAPDPAPVSPPRGGSRRERKSHRRWQFEKSTTNNDTWSASFKYVSEFTVLEPQLEELGMSFTPALEAISFNERTPPTQKLESWTRSSGGSVYLSDPHRRTGSSYGFKIRFEPPLKRGDEVSFELRVFFPEYHLSSREQLAQAQLANGVELSDYRWSGRSISVPTDDFIYEVILPKHLLAAPSDPHVIRYSNRYQEEEAFIRDSGAFIIQEIEEEGVECWLMRLRRLNPPADVTYRLRWRLPSRAALAAASTQHAPQAERGVPRSDL
ncbi:MAG TPA: toll/interleukin-1 receptor domain-containing protein [Jatrophihabitans sp.]|jgi:hypothetical protein|uniref:toll/interleukin-1 receptor domain-containing protein n=1 Tax=Jatrophihabitans sp. TaxID=1932789 RepID=UPI002F1CB2F9